MATKTIGPNFGNELAHAGLLGLPFSWTPDGTINFSAALTGPQIAAINAVYTAHNPATADPNATYAAAIKTGIVITSTATPALNATYALDDTTLTQIGSVARDAAGGLGLPGGAGTFTYPDIAGAPHSFAAADIQHLYKAMRDLVFALQTQLATALAGGTPVWPAQTATIA